ncbi:MAG: T9SS type A sorting domain-containing protein, partial [Bacteroidota bacterium]
GNETPDTRLKDWLDPEGLGLTRLKGMYKTDCDRQIRPSVFQELICARDTASYLLNLDAGLDDSITLSLRNLPDSIPFSFQRVDSQQIELLIFDASALINQARIFQVIASDSSFQTEVNLKLTVLSDSLSAVDLLLPEDESPSVSTSPTFSWLANSPELRYRFQLSTDSTFSTIALDSSGLSNEFLNVSDLVPSSNYYWRVRASSPCSEGEWSDVFSLTTASCRTYRSSDVPVNISAGGPRSYTSDLVVEEQGNIADVNVIALKGIHTWISDLQFDLVSPSGTRVTLMDRICLDERNFDIQFDDEAEAARLPCPPSDGLVYQPSGSLSSFEGEFTKGTWQLSFRDHQAQDGGQLQEWGIELCEVSKQFDIAVLLSQDSFLLCEEDSINLSVEIGTDFELAGLSIFLESAPGLITSSITPSEENDRMGIIALSQLDLLSDGIYNIAVVVDDGTFVSRANLRLEILSLPAVNLVRPENGTTALKVDEGLFEWNGIGQIDRYELLVATDSLFSNIVYQETSSNTFFGTGDSLLSNQNYYWQVRAQNKCGEVQSDLFQFLTETVVASKNIFSFDYKIYPNPTGDVLWIELEPSDAQLELYSNDGRLLMHRHFKERMNLDLSSYPSGIYQLRLVTKKGSVVEKVVKE